MGDITKLKGTELPAVDIITGGSPCQDLSIAGKRAGLSGERSGLFMAQIRGGRARGTSDAGGGGGRAAGRGFLHPPNFFPKDTEEIKQLPLAELFPDSWCGKTSLEHSHLQTEKISERSWRKSAGSPTIPYLFLDLRPGGGNLLGPYWEVDSLSLGESWTLNTGESPRDGRESSLSQILEEHPPRKYYLSRKACLGILRRSAERGKKLPEKLKKALEIQVGIK